MNLKKQELFEILTHQLSIEYNCKPEHFFDTKNIITPSTCPENRRHYINHPFFFQMVTLGQNAVITADKCLHSWLLNHVKNKPGSYLFEHRQLCALDYELKKYGKQLWQTHHMFLPYMEIHPVSSSLCVKWFEQEELLPLYDTKLFPNALCPSFSKDRPDMLAVAAYDGDALIGLAGCSADTPTLWQIGIDVFPKYRGHGVGTTLVTLLKNEIIRRGKIPFYGTNLSNLHSWNIAINSGFFPAWVEVETIESEKK